MGHRRIARERALQALYQLDVQAGSPVRPEDALDAAWQAAAEGGEPPPPADIRQFALELVIGVRKELAALDGLIEAHSHNWRVDRMARIDRNVLRLGAYELKFRPDVPKKVSLNEAVELGKRYGTEESSAFINGLLDKLAQEIDKP
jgi:transcription antitermination protein NusB